MSNLILRPQWWIPNRQITPEKVFANRRDFLRQLGMLGAGAAMGAMSLRAEDKPALPKGYPYARNPKYDPDWRLTDEKIAAKYNNFYEFTTVKAAVHRMVDKFIIDPWPIEIGGLVEKPIKVDVADLISQMPMEERVYRFRCVEAWSMTVPWTGFPLASLLKKVQPKAEAKFVRFQTFFRPDQAPGFAETNYPWPYTEGLRLDEAMHPLTMLVTGIYGKPLPKQHGAPIRVVVPWKYGYKSIKSIVKIELVDKQPSTLWETLAPKEYPFESNVNPAVPHPRWSQATERLIDTGGRANTQPFNGYGTEVASLYPKA